jgi:hypothetical protein
MEIKTFNTYSTTASKIFMSGVELTDDDNLFDQVMNRDFIFNFKIRREAEYL